MEQQVCGVWKIKSYQLHQGLNRLPDGRIVESPYGPAVALIQEDKKETIKTMVTVEKIADLKKSIEATIAAKDEIIAAQQKIIDLQKDTIKVLRSGIDSAITNLNSAPEKKSWWKILFTQDT
jgi:hypothetical protein